MSRLVRSLLVATLATSSACLAEEPLDEVSSRKLPGPGLFADNLPADLQSLVVPGKAGLHLDAAGKRRLFPMPRQPRQFASFDELADFAEEQLGARPVWDDEALVGFDLHTSQHGESVWIDAASDVVYRVISPAQAWLGGVTGQLVVDGKTICLDGRKTCDQGVATYLEPLDSVSARALSEVYACDENLFDGHFCARYHSFFNKFDSGVVRWARLGGNTRVVRNDGGKALRVGGIRVCAESDAGALVIGKRETGKPLAICLDWSLEELPPARRNIQVIGPFVAGSSGRSQSCGPGPTNQAFTETAVEHTRWVGAGSVVIDAWMVCNDHRSAAPPETTGAGPRGHECSSIFSEVC